MDGNHGHLVAGGRYRLARAFKDFDGVEHSVGETWWFLGHDYLPHDDGHTFHVRYDDGSDRSFRMCGAPEDQGSILSRFVEYVVPA